MSLRPARAAADGAGQRSSGLPSVALFLVDHSATFARSPPPASTKQAQKIKADPLFKEIGL